MEHGGGLTEILGAHVLLLADVPLNGVFHRVVEHGLNGLVQVLAVQHLPALFIDDLALGVHHIVVLEDVLAGLEVPGLHLALGIFNGVGEHLLFDGSVLVHAQLLHHAHHPLRAEQAHDVVLQGEIEAALARVALAAAELVVDAAGLVALGAQDEQAAYLTDLVRLSADLVLVLGLRLGVLLAGIQDLLVVCLGVAGGLGNEFIAHAGLAQVGLGQILRVAAQHNVGAAAGHVGGHSDRPQLTGLGDDLGLLLMVLGVEHIVLDALALEHIRQLLRLFNGDGAHQNGLSLLVALLDLPDDGTELARFILIHHIVVVNALDRAVGGDLHNVQFIDGAKLLLLGHGSTRHAGELVVQAEVVLEGDGGQGLGFVGYLHVLLGLDGLVEALVIAAAEHQAAGELVHDDDLALFDHIVDVPLHHAVGLDGLVDVVGEGGVLRGGQVFNLEGLLRLLDASGGEGSGARLLIDDIVGVDVDVLLLLGVHLGDALALQTGDELVHDGVQLGGLLTLAGDDKGGAGLVNEDGVHLVHHGEVMAPLHQLAGVDGHVVPEVVEAELVVGAVGDVGGVCVLLGLPHDTVDHQTHGEAHEAVHLAHPLRVALGQIVVDGDDVDAFARQGVQIGGESGHQRLALAGAHLCDAALVQDDAADELYPVGAHPKDAPGGLTAGGEGLGQDVIQRLAVGKALLELGGLGLELGVSQRLILLLQPLDLVHKGEDRLDLPLGAGPENLFEYVHKHTSML